MGPAAGIEIELWVIDRGGRLAEAAPLVAALPFVDPEILRSLVEVRTEPHHDLAALFRELRERTLQALFEAERLHLRLFAFGTPLNRRPLPVVDSARLAIQNRVDPGDVALERTLGRAGVHVHFDRDPDPRITRDRLNLLTALDPLAAGANAAPYLGRCRIASSSRRLVGQVRLGAVPDERSELWAYTGSIAAWEGRVDRLWRDYERTAGMRGVEPGELHRFLRPDDALWTPVRLRRRLATIEYRSLDAAPPGRLLPVVEDLARLVDRAGRVGIQVAGEPDGVSKGNGAPIVVPPFLLLRALAEEAARFGLRSEPLRSYLSRLGLEPARYRPLDQSLAHGDTLDDQAARRLRLHLADELERDVAGS